MSTSSTNPKTAPPISSDSLRIVLFGMPDSGKSALLAALGHSGETHERQLEGQLIDPAFALAELQQRLNERQPDQDQSEIRPYSLSYRPLDRAAFGENDRLSVVIYDCDGRAARDILSRQKSIEDRKSGQLARAILAADTLVLVVDAATSDDQMRADFAEFTRFLRLLEARRSRRSEVGSLPVFLVLTKCDLLARPDDSRSGWERRIEERQKQVEAQFREFLEDDAPPGFGSLELRVASTAIHLPLLKAAPPNDEPFGVASLFRGAFLAAFDYRSRAHQASRRLFAVASGAILLLVLLVGGAAMLAVSREIIQPNPLVSDVENYRSRENPAPSARLTEPLQRKISELTDIQRNPGFDKLPGDLKEYVSSRLRELTAYQNYKGQLERERPPAEMANLSELNRLENRLDKTVEPPAEYRDDWRQTDAELLRQKWLDDIRALRKASAELVASWGSLTEAGNALAQFRDGREGVLPWSEWHDRVRDLLARASHQPHVESEPLNGSRALPAFRAPAVTYGAVFSFRPVEDARRDWESVRRRLERIRDESLVLGLAGNGVSESAPLKLPNQMSPEQIHIRLQQLDKAYPEHDEWSIQDVPDSVGGDIRIAAQSSYSRLVAAGQEIVLRELARISPDGQETRERWLTVARLLPDSPQLRELSQMARILQRLSGMPLSDPVAALAAFLQQPNFVIRFGTIRMTVPDDADDQRIRPSGNLTITHMASSGPVVLTFRRSDEEVRDNRRRSTTYTFVQEGDQKLNYSPGDAFFADLSVRDGAMKDAQLTWLRIRSDQYRFECLERTPRLHLAGASATDGPVKDIHLSFNPESGLPHVPDLMPTVILSR
jgi:hypothetical protein